MDGEISIIDYPKTVASLVFMVSVTALGCWDATKLIYFGFTDHSETRQDAVRLAEIWGHDKVCAHWRPTVSEKEADYRVLFGSSGDVTILGHRGEVLYTGGEGVLYLPHGNPDGSGVNICKLTGE
jgi:hypothetical protein